MRDRTASASGIPTSSLIRSTVGPVPPSIRARPPADRNRARRDRARYDRRRNRLDSHAIARFGQRVGHTNQDLVNAGPPTNRAFVTDFNPNGNATLYAMTSIRCTPPPIPFSRDKLPGPRHSCAAAAILQRIATGTSSSPPRTVRSSATTPQPVAAHPMEHRRPRRHFFRRSRPQPRRTVFSPPAIRSATKP